MSAHNTAAFTPEQIDVVRTLRGFAVDWPVVAARVGRSVDECRAAIGLPPSLRPEPPAALPWECQARQRNLFD